MNKCRIYLLDHAMEWDKFGAELRSKIDQTQMSFRQIADDLGYATSVHLFHICKGKHCSVALYLQLCHDFGIDPLAYFTPYNEENAPAS